MRTYFTLARLNHVFPILKIFVLYKCREGEKKDTLMHYLLQRMKIIEHAARVLTKNHEKENILLHFYHCCTVLGFILRFYWFILRPNCRLYFRKRTNKTDKTVLKCINDGAFEGCRDTFEKKNSFMRWFRGRIDFLK